MKNIILLTTLLISSIGFSQKINLTDKEEVIKQLNKKEFNVGKYGKMILFYDDYDKDFKTLKFKVEFTPASNDKKSKKIKLATDIFVMDGFYNPSYMTSFVLKTAGALMNENYEFPTMFLLFENGELYFADKINISMEDYIKLITKETVIKTGNYVLCK